MLPCFTLEVEALPLRSYEVGRPSPSTVAPRKRRR